MVVEVIDQISIVTGVACFIILCVGLFYCGKLLQEHSKAFKDLAPVLYALSFVCFTFIFTAAVAPWFPQLAWLWRLIGRPPIYIATFILIRYIYRYRYMREE